MVKIDIQVLFKIRTLFFWLSLNMLLGKMRSMDGFLKRFGSLDYLLKIPCKAK